MKSRSVGSEELCPGSNAVRFLVITEMHLLPTACGSSSIAASAASPLLSHNEAGKSARDGRNDAYAPTAQWKRTRGSNSDGKMPGGEEVNVGLCVTYMTAGSFHTALGARLSNNLFLKNQFQNINLRSKITKTGTDGNGMERHSIKPLNKEEYGGNHGPQTF